MPSRSSCAHGVRARVVHLAVAAVLSLLATSTESALAIPLARRASVPTTRVAPPPPELTLWVEYPVYGAPLAGMDDYFAALVSFVAERGIDRLIFRVQDPGSFTMYQPPASAGASPCSAPSAAYPHILDETTEGQNERDQCCIGACGKSGLWCDGYTAEGEPTQSTHQCSGGCGAVVPCGSGDLTGLFFTDLLLDAKFVSTGCEVYVVPWLNDENPWSFPDAKANNVVNAAEWIQLANEYSSQHGGRLISGLVYEQEDAGTWSDKTVALPALSQALAANLAAPSPAYANDASSDFKLASASQFDLDDGGTGVYIHEIFPQVYNLTSGSAPVRVDATSSSALLADPASYAPDFPDTIYTLCTTPASIAGACGFGSLIETMPPAGRAADVHYMFSTELAPKTVAGIANTHHDRGCTITGACDASDTVEACVGTINAFGSPGWSWNDLMAFFGIWGSLHGASQFAIFQFNMLPPSWDASGGGCSD
jgi:hypothetical protein